VASLFEPSINGIINAVQEQVAKTTNRVSAAFLVGGFAASPWLFSRLEARLQPHRMGLCKPHIHTNKAVAEGAASFFLKHFVFIRIAKITYGKCHFVAYDPTDPEHIVRRERISIAPSGRPTLPGCFSTLIPQGARIRESDEFKLSFFQEALHDSALDHIDADVDCYRGKAKQPCWVDKEPEMFHTLCTLSADTSSVARTRSLNPRGEPYYTQGYNVILYCGLTEMKAQISWMQDGKERRGPASIIYNVEGVF